MRLGDNSGSSLSYELQSNTTYYLASGTHTLGSSQYGQFQPQNGDTFIGAPGAILNGEGINQSAFDGTSTGVTIEYLTVENFVAPDGQMVVNHDGGANWTVKYDTVINNGGAGVGLGTGDVVESNCLSGNDEYGFSSFGGASNVTLTGNEISKNDTNGTYDQGAYLKSYSVAGNVATIDTKAPVERPCWGHDHRRSHRRVHLLLVRQPLRLRAERHLDDRGGPLEHRVHLRRDHRERGDDQRSDRDDRRPAGDLWLLGGWEVLGHRRGHGDQQLGP